LPEVGCRGNLSAWMRLDAVLRWVVTGLAAAFVAAAVLLIIVEPIVGLFAVAGAAVGVVIRFFWPGEEVNGRPRPAEHRPALGRIVALLISGAAAVSAITILLEQGGQRAPVPPVRVVLRVPYVAELSYVDAGRWQGVETLRLDGRDLEVVLRRRGRGPPARRLKGVLPVPWRLLRVERIGVERFYVFGRDAMPVGFQVPRWRPFTASHTIPVPAVRSRLLRAQLVAAEGSQIRLRAPERRVWRTTPGSEATPDAQRADWEQREVSVRVGGRAAAGEDVVVEVRSDLATQELFPQAVVGASGWAGLKWVFGILGLGAVVSAKVREFMWGWLRRVLGSPANRRRSSGAPVGRRHTRGVSPRRRRPRRRRRRR
jgi:hypothetical protein